MLTNGGALTVDLNRSSDDRTTIGAIIEATLSDKLFGIN